MKEIQKWLVIEEGDWHIVIPDIDIRPHAEVAAEDIKKLQNTTLELAGTYCPCNPKIDWQSNLITHNSFAQQDAIDESMSKFL